MSEIQLLRDSLQGLNLPYKEGGMVETTSDLQVSGTAFFPVGRGLWLLNDNTLSNKKVMVLGQDFGTVNDVKTKVLGNDCEDTKGNPTWNNLLKLLEMAGINYAEVFFTNAVMGLRLEGKNTDTPTAFRHHEFLNGCRAFFLEQVRMQKPQLILTLGFWPIHFLRENLSVQLSEKWASVKSISSVVTNDNLAAIRDVQFTGIPGFKTNLVALLHPSLRNVNVARLSRKHDDTFYLNTESERIKRVLTI